MVVGRGRWGRFLRYAATSAVATAVSAACFAVAYRLLRLGPEAASGCAFAGGALVNFTGSRFWAWARRERRGLGRDAAGYAALAIGTALAALGVTTLADAYAGRLAISDDQRTLVVEAAYFATYGAVFLVKFVLLDRFLFGSERRPATGG